MAFVILAEDDQNPIDNATGDDSGAMDMTGANFIVVAGWGWKSASDFTVAGVTDTEANTYTVEHSTAQAGQNARVFCAWAENPTVDASVVVTVDTGDASYFSYTVLAVSGMETASLKRESVINGSGTATTAPTTNATAAATLTGDLCIAAYTCYGGSTPISIAVEAGWDERVEQTDNDSHQAGEVDSQAATGDGAQTCTWVTESMAYSCGLWVFKTASAAANKRRYTLSLLGAG